VFNCLSCTSKKVYPGIYDAVHASALLDTIEHFVSSITKLIRNWCSHNESWHSRSKYSCLCIRGSWKAFYGAM